MKPIGSRIIPSLFSCSHLYDSIEMRVGGRGEATLYLSFEFDLAPITNRIVYDAMIGCDAT